MSRSPLLHSAGHYSEAVTVEADKIIRELADVIALANDSKTAVRAKRAQEILNVIKSGDLKLISARQSFRLGSRNLEDITEEEFQALVREIDYLEPSDDAKKLKAAKEDLEKLGVDAAVVATINENLQDTKRVSALLAAISVEGARDLVKMLSAIKTANGDKDAIRRELGLKTQSDAFPNPKAYTLLPVIKAGKYTTPAEKLESAKLILADLTEINRLTEENLTSHSTLDLLIKQNNFKKDHLTSLCFILLAVNEDDVTGDNAFGANEEDGTNQNLPGLDRDQVAAVIAALQVNSGDLTDPAHKLEALKAALKAMVEDNSLDAEIDSLTQQNLHDTTLLNVVLNAPEGKDTALRLKNLLSAVSKHDSGEEIVKELGLEEVEKHRPLLELIDASPTATLELFREALRIRFNPTTTIDDLTEADLELLLKLQPMFAQAATTKENITDVLGVFDVFNDPASTYAKKDQVLESRKLATAKKTLKAFIPYDVVAHGKIDAANSLDDLDQFAPKAEIDLLTAAQRTLEEINVRIGVRDGSFSADAVSEIINLDPIDQDTLKEAVLEALTNASDLEPDRLSTLEMRSLGYPSVDGKHPTAWSANLQNVTVATTAPKPNFFTRLFSTPDPDLKIHTLTLEDQAAATDVVTRLKKDLPKLKVTSSGKEVKITTDLSVKELASRLLKAHSRVEETLRLIELAKQDDFSWMQTQDFKSLNINQQDADGYTLLHYAAVHANEQACRTLLGNGANPLLKNNSRWLLWGQETPRAITDKENISDLLRNAEAEWIKSSPSNLPRLRDFKDGEEALKHLTKTRPELEKDKTIEFKEIAGTRYTMIKLSNNLTINGESVSHVGITDKGEYCYKAGQFKTCKGNLKRTVAEVVFKRIHELRPQITQELPPLPLGTKIVEKNPDGGTKLWKDLLKLPTSHLTQDSRVLLPLPGKQLIDSDGTQTELVAVDRNGKLAYYNSKEKDFRAADGEQRKELMATLNHELDQYEYQTSLESRVVLKPTQSIIQQSPSHNPNNPKAPITQKISQVLPYESYQVTPDIYPASEELRAKKIAQTLASIHTTKRPENFQKECELCGIFSPNKRGGITVGLTYEEAEKIPGFTQEIELQKARTTTAALLSSLTEIQTRVANRKEPQTTVQLPAGQQVMGYEQFKKLTGSQRK